MRWWSIIICRYTLTSFPGPFPKLGAGREKALSSAGHVSILHPEILCVINWRGLHNQKRPALKPGKRLGERGWKFRLPVGQGVGTFQRETWRLDFPSCWRFNRWLRKWYFCGKRRRFHIFKEKFESNPRMFLANDSNVFPGWIKSSFRTCRDQLSYLTTSWGEQGETRVSPRASQGR